MNLSTHYVFLPKMCPQIDKPLRFQEISHIEEHITLPPRGPIPFPPRGIGVRRPKCHCTRLDGQFPALSSAFFPIWRFGPVELYVRATHRELASPSAKLCGLREQKATDSKGVLLSYATFFARTHNGSWTKPRCGIPVNATLLIFPMRPPW